MLRSRFILPSVVAFTCHGALSGLAFTMPSSRALGVAGFTLLGLSFLSGRDGEGRVRGPGRIFLLVATMPAAHLVVWARSGKGGAALDAAFSYRYDEALDLAAHALAVDPSDRTALMAECLSAQMTGDTLRALHAAQRLTEAGDLVDQISAQADLGYAWLLAREAGTAPADWYRRAHSALQEAEDLGGRSWQLDDSWALLHVLQHRTDAARACLVAPLREAVYPEERASVLLTLALVHSQSADGARADDLVAEAQRLWPSHPRIPHVRRVVSQPPQNQ